MIENSPDDCAVTFDGDGLVATVVVVVVVVEAKRESFEDGRGQFTRLAAPVFFRVSVKKRFVEFISDEFEGLFLEVRRGVDGLIGAFGNEGLGFIGRQVGPEELINRVKIEWKRKNSVAVDGFDAVDIGPKFAEAVDVFPDVFLRSVEDMRPIFVEQNSGGFIAFGVTVTCEVLALVNDLDAGSKSFRKLPGQHGSRKACADDEKFGRQLKDS